MFGSPYAKASIQTGTHNRLSRRYFVTCPLTEHRNQLHDNVLHRYTYVSAVRDDQSYASGCRFTNLAAHHFYRRPSIAYPKNI